MLVLGNARFPRPDPVHTFYPVPSLFQGWGPRIK